MNSYNKQALDIIAKEQGFIRDNLEKVILPVLRRSEHFDFEKAKDKEMVNRIKFHPMALWKTRSH